MAPHSIYFRVPTFSTGYGLDFDTYADALRYAQSRQTTPHVRTFVEVRVKDATSDSQLARWEIPNTLAEAS